MELIVVTHCFEIYGVHIYTYIQFQFLLHIEILKNEEGARLPAYSQPCMHDVH